MPQTVNGIGTNYAGRDNIHISTDTCNSCGAYTSLESFDTTLYFVCVFIPILPLGRKRILNKCPSCTYHYAIPLKDWEKQKTEGLAKAAEGFRANPGSEEHAIEALGAVVAFQDKEEFTKLAGAIRTQMAQNPGVMSELARGYAYFRQPDDAINVLFQTAALHEDDDLNEQLAFLLIDQKRPDEAAPLVRHIYAKKDTEKVGLLMLLIESFQAVGDHSGALQVIGEVKQEFPDLADDRQLKRAEKLSQKNVESGKKITSKNLGSASPATSGGGLGMGGASAKWVSRFAMLAIALVLTGIAYGLLSNAIGPQKTYVINGLKVGYEVDINGETFNVGPGNRIDIKLKEGPVTVKFLSGVKYPEQTGTIQTSFWKRMFGGSVRIINPDGCGALLWENTEYSDRPASKQKYEYKVHAGKLIHVFDDIDHEFENFPDQIESESSRVMRTRLTVWAAEPVMIFGVLGKAEDMTAAMNYARRLVMMDPNQSNILAFLARTDDDESMIKMLRTRLDDRPLLIDWHRHYQEVGGRMGIDLVAEYDAKLKKEPANAALLYLRGRAEPDQTQAQEFYRKAMKGSNLAAAYATNALAYQKLALGDFEEALLLTSRVMKGKFKDNLNFRGSYLQALLAMKEYRHVLDLCEKAEQVDVFNNRALRIHALHRVKGLAAAREFRQTKINQFKQQNLDKQEIKIAGHVMEAHIRHAAGDMPGFISELSNAGEGADIFALALCRGDLQKAAKALNEDQFAETSSYVLLYIAANHRKKSVATYRKLASERLSKGPEEEKLMAKWIAGEEKPDYKRASAFIIQPGNKTIFLTALALDAKSDKNRDKLLKLAAKFNFNLDFPRLFLKQVIEKQN